MKNKEIVAYLNHFSKIEGLKLGGVRTKIVLKNKKALVREFELQEEVKAGLIKQYVEDGDLSKLSEEDMKKLNAEWAEYLNKDSDIVIEKFSAAELDQFMDLTLEQIEVLDIMVD